VAKPLRERPRIHKNCGSCERSARAYASRASWDTVFDGLYGAYERGLRKRLCGAQAHPHAVAASSRQPRLFD